MANAHSTLASLFTDIAKAIRSKTGGTGAIVADKFPDAIAAIDTQENLDAELTAQDDLIAQINTALEGKAVSGGGTSGPVVETSTVTFSAVDAEEVFYTRFENGELVHYDGIHYDYTNQTIENIVLGSLIHIFLNGEWYEKETQGAEIINTYGDGSYTYLIYQVLEPNAYIALEYV